MDQIAAGELDIPERLRQRVGLILLEGGIGDENKDPAVVEVNAISVMQSLREAYPDAVPVVLGLFADANGFISEVRSAVDKAIERAASATGYMYISTATWRNPENAAGLNGADRAYPSSQGHLSLAEVLKQVLSDRQLAAQPDG
ncbi:hypothetical protein GCM10007304_49840 [Rhodococcoides trifolii]|uniref:Uncharacterized protein n=1 Tax=Rhodococcoides trifolii TaxID=908250 RepID=A0A917G9L2_9NOCA|nr:hypothetical protein GCM10007304_49840 [Rhodococcus trifolii]